jgi:hypothetical protein
MARSYAFLGRRSEALALLDTLKGLMHQEFIPAALFADIYLALGDQDRAFEFLDLAIEERAVLAIWPLFDRNWDALRGDPRFPPLLARVGLLAET